MLEVPAPTPLEVPGYQLPTSEPVPAFHVECRGTGQTPWQRTKTYIFAPIALSPIRRGPRLADRSRAGFVRTPGDLQQMLEQRLAAVEDCWRWASARGALATTFDLAVTIDPFGDTTDLAITSTKQADAALLACVREQFVGAASNRIVTHATRLTAKLAFERVEQAALRKGDVPPARPTAPPAPAPRTTKVCTPVLDREPPNTIAIATPFVLLDDDVSRGNRMTHAQSAKLFAQRAARRRCTARDSIEIDKVRTRETVMSNHGAFQACYADAHERNPALTGEVLLRLTFSQPGGLPSAVAVSGAGDAVFHACLETAATELWLQPPPLDTLEVEVPLRLDPPTTPTTVDGFLAAGDPAGALALLEQQLRREPDPVVRCTHHANVVLATAQLAPWLDDPRMRGAIANLTAALKPVPEASRAVCTAPIAHVLLHLTRSKNFRANRAFATSTWLRRYEMALPLASYMGSGNYLRWSHAIALSGVDRDAGRELLRELEEDPEIGVRVTETIALLDQALDPLDAVCLP